MTAQLKVLQGNGHGTPADACGNCVYERETTAVTWRCRAFGGVYTQEVRARYPIRCPGFVAKKARTLPTPRPAGWLLRFVQALRRWIW